MESGIKRSLGSSHASNVPPPPPPQISTPHICKTRKAEVRKALTETTDHNHKYHPPSHGLLKYEGARTDTNEMEELRKNLEKARAKLERRDERITFLESQVARANNRNSLEIEKKLEALVLQHAASKSKYHAELDSHRNENQKLQQSLSSHIKDTADFRRKYDLIDKENINLKREVESLRHAQTHSNEIASASRKEIKEFQDEQTKWKVEKHHLEREVGRLQVELEHAHKQRKESRETAHAEQVEIKQLREENRKRQKEVARLREELRGLNEVEEENERLENLLSASAVAFRLSYKHSVSKKEYQALQERYLLMRTERDQWRTKTLVKHRHLSSKTKEVAILHEQIRTMHEERKVLEDIVDDLMKDRESLRNVCTSVYRLPILPTYESEGSVNSTGYSQLVDRALSHADIQTSHLSAQLDTLWEEYSPLRATHDEIESNLVSSQLTLAALQRSMAELQDRHTSLEGEHSSCTSKIVALTQESRNASAIAEVYRVDMDELRGEMKRVQDKARDDREALRRANEVVSRSKTAEGVLDEEVQHLREAYLAAAQYEDLYNDLLEEKALIMVREEAAIQEAERLGLENAELAGHTNEGQKINYVEGLRREMFGVKQELATTRHMLNRANDKIIDLKQEISTYRSIDPTSQPLAIPDHSRSLAQSGLGLGSGSGFGSSSRSRANLSMGLGMGKNMGASLNMGGSTRTKVTRKSMVVHRQPEGGRLSLSTSATTKGKGTGRSVSGLPVSGGRL